MSVYGRIKKALWTVYLKWWALRTKIVTAAQLMLPRKKTEHCDKPYDLAIVAIAKNEGEYIREWVQFHKKANVTKIILYDNDSDDNMAEEIRDEIDSGFVIYRQIHGRAQQLNAYNLAFAEFGKMFKMIAVIDCDEFLYSTDGRLVENLREYFTKERCGAVIVNWSMYGSSGYIENPHTGGVVDTFLYRAEIGKRGTYLTKPIIDPDKFKCFKLNPHEATLKRGYVSYNTLGKVNWGGACNYRIKSYGTIRLNHYFTKSLEEYKRRRAFGKADQLESRPLDDFYAHDNNDVYDDSALEFIKKGNAK